MTLRSKYTNMYIPSDFFNASSPWVDNLPLKRPFVLGQQCKFHVMHKEVSPLTAETAVLDPPDADHKYCAKVSKAADSAKPRGFLICFGCQKKLEAFEMRFCAD